MIALYFDENFPGWIMGALRREGIDVLAVQEDGCSGGPDPQVLDRAVALGRVLVTRDRDFFAIERQCRDAARHHLGLVHYKPDLQRHSAALDSLILLCQVMEPEDLHDKIEHIPY